MNPYRVILQRMLPPEPTLSKSAQELLRWFFWQTGDGAEQPWMVEETISLKLHRANITHRFKHSLREILLELVMAGYVEQDLMIIENQIKEIYYRRTSKETPREPISSSESSI